MTPQYQAPLLTFQSKDLLCLYPAPAPRNGISYSSKCIDSVLSQILSFLPVIDVYQAWCGPCKAMQTLFRKLKNELNEDEMLHFAVVRISFPLNYYFLVTLRIVLI